MACYKCLNKATYRLEKYWQYPPDELHFLAQLKKNISFLCSSCFHEEIGSIDSKDCIDENGNQYTYYPNPPVTYFEREQEHWYGYPLHDKKDKL